MKNLLMLALAASLLTACGGDEEPAATGGQFDDPVVVKSFTTSVILPTYGELDVRAAALKTAVDALAADPTDANLESAREAWRATRVPWETSEGFLFGPVDSLGYDPALDSWPVNRTDLDAVLASDDELTTEYVANLPNEQKGFHTIEYLLFGMGGSKTAADLSERELSYLAATTAELAEVANALATSWTDGVQSQQPYADVFSSAGEPGNGAYPSLSAAGQEVVGGMVGILDEVANGKIADPYDAQDPTLVESQFSYNSLTDFRNNLRSVENAYAGAAFGGSSATSMSDWVASQNPELDERILAEMEAAGAALEAIPEPFRDSITDPEAADEIEAAQSAIRALQSTLESQLLPLVQS